MCLLCCDAGVAAGLSHLTALRSLTLWFNPPASSVPYLTGLAAHSQLTHMDLQVDGHGVGHLHHLPAQLAALELSFNGVQRPRAAMSLGHLTALTSLLCKEEDGMMGHIVDILPDDVLPLSLQQLKVHNLLSVQQLLPLRQLAGFTALLQSPLDLEVLVPQTCLRRLELNYHFSNGRHNNTQRPDTSGTTGAAAAATWMSGLQRSIKRLATIHLSAAAAQPVSYLHGITHLGLLVNEADTLSTLGAGLPCLEQLQELKVFGSDRDEEPVYVDAPTHARALLQGITGLRQLRQLQLRDIKLDATCLQLSGGHTCVTSLRLRSCGLDDLAVVAAALSPGALSSWQHLQALDLGDNTQLTDAMTPALVQYLPQLTFLGLDGCLRITDVSAPWFTNLQQLEHLVASECRKDVVVQVLEQCRQQRHQHA